MVSQSTKDLLSTTDKLFLSFAFQMPCLPKDKKKRPQAQAVTAPKTFYYCFKGRCKPNMQLSYQKY